MMYWTFWHRYCSNYTIFFEKFTWEISSIVFEHLQITLSLSSQFNRYEHKWRPPGRLSSLRAPIMILLHDYTELHRGVTAAVIEYAPLANDVTS